MSGINARTEYELNAGGEPVKNATYWKRQYAKLADRIAELEKKSKPVAWMMKYRNKKISLSFEKFQLEDDNTNYFNIPLYTTPQIKPLSDEEMNKAFDYYCETDEGVLRFDYELRKEWKEKELQRWKEAFARAIEERILGK